MSILKRILKDGTTRWEVRAWTNGRGSTRVARSFERKLDAEEYFRDFKTRTRTVNQGPIGIANFEDTTFADEAQAWLDDGQVRFSASHLVRVKGVLSELLPKIGRLTPDRLTPLFLSSIQRQMKAEGAKNLTVNRKTEVVTAILNFSVKQRRIPFNPAAGFRKLPSDQAEMQFWDRSEAESFLRFTEDRYP